MQILMTRFIEDKLQSALNHYLALDPESKNKLPQLANKAITIQFQGINITCQLQFSDTQIYVKFSDFKTPNTIIKSLPISMLRMALTKENRKKFFEEGTVIEGDVDLGLTVIKLFDELDIDWEEYLSNYIGDISAHQLNRAFSQIKQFSQRVRRSLTQSTNEYVHEEINLFPSREALADFFHEIDDLRMDTDRLEARLNQLEKTAKKRETL